MISGYSAITKKGILWSTMLCMVALLLLLAPLARCGASASSRHPHLNTKRLLHAYTLHRRGLQPTLEYLTWSPDRRHAFYTISEKLRPENGRRRYTLFAVRRNGSHIRKLYRWEHPGGLNPDAIDWAPDSSRIVMRILNFSPASSVNADGVQLIDVNPETQEKRKLSRDLGGKPGSGSILDRPGYYTFSPNGKYLLLTLGGDRQDLNNKRLVRIDYATGKRKLLTPFKMTARDAHWSPDGKHILYTALPDAGRIDFPPGSDQEANYTHRIRQRHLYIMDADGRRKRLLTADKGDFKVKSPLARRH
ncbi:MAG: Dipeptidyl peptidase N-terminal region [Chthonomonadales bacterium]|nr:Dipeptidyl peptidase N-terminal region [Chthonomonadales bacterium]